MRRKTSAVENERRPGPSPCCGNVVIRESIYVWQSAADRKDTHGGRTQIGTVKTCGHCLKATTQPRAIPNSIAPLTASAWTHLLQENPTAPFYFSLQGGRLLPQGYENTKPPITQGSLPYGDPGRD